ncbi:hypothetical protein ACHQM5_006044 [Ranunculus cassubicifolius]
MEFFHNAKVVRLKSHHEKYLLADDDEETVCQDRNGSCRNARWTVEFVDGIGHNGIIRLNSCYGKYLTASNSEYLLGVTGKKVVQSIPRRIDSSVEWEPIREGMQVKLKTRYGNYLRANGGVPPWRNSITHDIPHRHQDWVLWDVDIIQILPTPTPPPVTTSSPSMSKLESSDSFVYSPPKDDGRTIHYHVAEDNGDVDDSNEGASFFFKGSGVEELKEKLVEETGIEDVIVCTKSPLNGNIYPLRLHLPPNHTTMHIIVVKSSSKVARNFEKAGLL